MVIAIFFHLGSIKWLMFSVEAVIHLVYSSDTDIDPINKK